MKDFKRNFITDTTRLKDWDYSDGGWYFVTICTKDKLRVFGEVSRNKVVLSKLGKIASQFWEEIPDHHAGIHVDEFVIMPNHVHGIIEILPVMGANLRTESVETLHATSLQSGKDHEMAAISPRKGSLSVIIRSYKSAVSRWAHKNGYDSFAWQSRFYDHIIRDERSLASIRSYIRNNPLQWELDRFFSTDF